MIQYASREPQLSASAPYTNGITAPPAIPITSNDDAAFVKRPTPARAKGQIAGHMREFESPNKAINAKEI